MHATIERTSPRSHGSLIGAVAVLALAGCVFVPPPPLPEEVAAEEAARQARIEALRGGEAEPQQGPAEAETAGEEVELTFKPGDPVPPGMSLDQLADYRASQGDPVTGDFTLEQALAGIPGRGELWALIRTTRGTLQCQLFPEQVPLTVANFVGLARGLRPFRDPKIPNTPETPNTTWVNRPYYDGTTFHRVIPGFMIQGGDPTATGTGGPGYVIADEFSPDLLHERAGIMSMANRNKANTGGAQFFITLNPTPHLDGVHAVFGACDEASTGLADDMSLVPRDQSNKPDEPDVVEGIDFEFRAPQASE